LDQALNGPAGGAVDYRAITGHAVLSFADIRSISSLDPADVHLGHSDEVDVVFWIPAAAYVEGILDHLVFFCPYIWVTNPYAMATGREVYGYPKSLGWAQLPHDANDPGPLWAETMVIPQYTPGTTLQRRRIFTLSRAAGPAGRAFGPGETRAAVTHLLDALVGIGVSI